MSSCPFTFLSLISLLHYQFLFIICFCFVLSLLPSHDININKFPVISPPGYPPSPASWRRSPGSLPPPTPPAPDYPSSLPPPSPLHPPPSPLHPLQNLDTPNSAGLGGLDINVNPSASSFNSFMSSPSPSYSSTNTGLDNMLTGGGNSLSGNNNNNTNSSISQRGKLTQLLTQSTTPEPLHSPASSEGRRPVGPIAGRSRRISGQIGSSGQNPVSSSGSNTNPGSVGLPTSIASLSVDMPGLSGNSTGSSSEQEIHQSPTEGPGESPQQVSE